MIKDLFILIPSAMAIDAPAASNISNLGLILPIGMLVYLAIS